MVFNRVNKSSQGSLGVDAKSWLGVSNLKSHLLRLIFNFKKWLFRAVL